MTDEDREDMTDEDREDMTDEDREDMTDEDREDWIMKCPTCENAEEGKCCSCGDIIPIEKQELEPNPFAFEIERCPLLHLECEACREEAVRAT